MARKRSQQLSLLSHNKSSSGPHTLYLRKTGDFEGLISGFHSIRAVSCVASPSLMYTIFDKYGFPAGQTVLWIFACRLVYFCVCGCSAIQSSVRTGRVGRAKAQ